MSLTLVGARAGRRCMVFGTNVAKKQRSPNLESSARSNLVKPAREPPTAQTHSRMQVRTCAANQAASDILGGMSVSGMGAARCGARAAADAPRAGEGRVCGACARMARVELEYALWIAGPCGLDSVASRCRWPPRHPAVDAPLSFRYAPFRSCSIGRIYMWAAADCMYADASRYRQHLAICNVTKGGIDLVRPSAPIDRALFVRTNCPCRRCMQGPDGSCAVGQLHIDSAQTFPKLLCKPPAIPRAGIF